MPRGDYHPVSADLFFRHASLIQEAGAEGFIRIGGLDRFRPAEGPSGRAIAAQLTQSLSPEQTGSWQLDLTELQSVSSGQAWFAYGQILRRTDAPTHRRTDAPTHRSGRAPR